MQKHKSIKGLFFLSIFSMLLLHQVAPHWHHQHEEKQDHRVAHSHQDHHHHKQPEKETPKKGFLDWFLEMHTHTSTTSDALVLKQTTVKKITVEQETVVYTVITNTYNLVVYEADTTTKKWYQPPDKLQTTHLPNLSLRGPPDLG